MSDHEEQHQEVLVKTDGFTVIQETVPPGCHIPVHTHHIPHVVIPLRGGKVEQLDAEGELLFDLEFDDLSPDFFIHVPAERLPITHSLRNVSDTPWVHVRIEYGN